MPFGDVLLARLPFPDGAGFKNRPILLVHDHGDSDLLVAPITSHHVRGIADTRIEDWQAAGLRVPSTVRMSRLATLAKTVVLHELGSLTLRDISTTRRALREFLASLPADT